MQERLRRAPALGRAALPRPLSRLIAPLTMALPVTIFGVAALSFPLTLARLLGVPGGATASWIATLYGVPGVLSLALTWWYRQPLLVAWSTLGTVAAATFVGQASYPELRGASMVAGALVFLLGAVGLSERVARWVPPPIVMAMVAGAVLPYVAGMFSTAGAAPLVVGGAFLAYILGRRFLPSRIPPVLPGVVVGLGAAAFTGILDPRGFRFAAPALQGSAPGFAWTAIVSFAPVLAVLMSTSANLASVVYIRSQRYPAALRAIDIATGAATMAGSFFGFTPICMASFLAAPTAGPDAGDHDVRHWSVYFSSIGFFAIAALAGLAADLLRIVPLSVLLALAGLALISVLGATLQEAVRGPLVFGPLMTFAVAVSHLSYLGFGPLLWSLVIGTATSAVLEREQFAAVRAAAGAAAAGIAQGGARGTAP
ncbi:MAG TPA: benzoate/H(+) symporter BenE family transporter [bacterium]|nr:benzoate/H(+) symporter BenE family transporter [bacterium]